MILANVWDRPTPGDIDQESSQLCTQTIVATERMQSFMFPQDIVQEMIRRDHCENREITPNALYTCIKSAITLICGLNGSVIEEGAIESVMVTGVCMAIINTNPSFHIVEVESPPPQAQRMLLLPPQRPSPLPHQLSLTSTSISGDHLSMANDGTTRSVQFAIKSVKNLFLATIIAPRLFPQKILDIKVHKTPPGFTKRDK